MSIRPASIEDLSVIATIHKAQFPTHFLGQYSISLLAGFYRSFLGHSVFLVHDTADGVNGFVLGGGKEQLVGAKAAFVRRNLLHCICDTLLRPHVWWQAVCRGIAALRAPSRLGMEPRDPFQELPAFSLLSIAVADTAMGTGVAQALVQAFDREITPHTTRYSLSVEKHNTRAIRFYEKMGFVCVEDDGEDCRFQKDLVATQE